MFRLNRNERSHWSGNGVHVESELVFMIGRNMQIGKRCLIYSGGRFDNVAIEPETGEHWGSVIWCEYV